MFNHPKKSRFYLSAGLAIALVAACFSLLLSAGDAQAAPGDDLIITAVYDGPLTGGVPKGVELYVVNNIADLSVYGLGSANNGGGTDGEEFTFPADSATAGQFIYIASESVEFANFFGFAPDYTSGAMLINGDDAVELFANGSVSDVFGEINVDGTGQPWEYLDGWAYRNDNTGPDGSTFVLANWYFSGINALDGETSNATAATPVPIGTYSQGPAAPNFQISKSAPAMVNPGAMFTYTLTINNNTGITATNTVVTDVVPANTAFAGASNGGMETGGVVNWAIAGDFPDGATITRTFMVTASGSNGVEMVNSAYGVSASNWMTTAVGSPVSTTTTPIASCSDVGVPIYAIQGTTNVSPCENQTVTAVPGCITGIANGGFYYQSAPGDGDPATSDGIFVYRGSWWTNGEGYQVGNMVEVSGQIIEFYDITEFDLTSTVTVIDNGNDCNGAGYLAPVTVTPVADPYADPIAAYEQYESMLAEMSFNGWVTGATKRYISDNPHGDPEIAFVDFSSSIPAYSRVFESDYPGYQGISYLSGALGYDLPDLDFGDEISGTAVSGVFAYNFDKYTLLVDHDVMAELDTIDNPDATAVIDPINPAYGEFDICFFNVENLFDNVDDGNGDWGDWAPGWPDSGTPAGAAEYQAKLDHVAETMVTKMHSCMVIGVAEMEGEQKIYDDLAAALNTHISATHTYAGIYAESGDGRDISQGFLYRDDVTLLSYGGVSGAPYTGWVNDGALDFRRVPTTAEFRFHAGTSMETDIHAYAMHFKSKRASASCTTPDCTDAREEEAKDLRDILAHHENAGELAIGGGDFNDVMGSTPIGFLDASSDSYNLFYDLPNTAWWSYVFNGESEVLDHIYVTSNLTQVVTPTMNWLHQFSVLHINADFPSAERVSDHDPVRVLFSDCRLVPPTAVTPTIAISGTAIALNWTDHYFNANGYAIYRDDAPYAPINELQTTDAGAMGYLDNMATGLGDPSLNHFYTIAPQTCDGDTVYSAQVGEFDFAITPGS